MKIIVLFFCCVTVFISCKEKYALQYTQDKLVDVTVDLYIAAEAIKRLDAKRADSLRTLYSEQIEEIHDVDIKLYEKDIEFLKKELKTYVDFNKIVADSLKVYDERNRQKSK